LPENSTATNHSFTKSIKLAVEKSNACPSIQGITPFSLCLESLVICNAVESSAIEPSSKQLKDSIYLEPSRKI
jgi:hypothetical protein